MQIKLNPSNLSATDQARRESKNPCAEVLYCQSEMTNQFNAINQAVARAQYNQVKGQSKKANTVV